MSEQIYPEPTVGIVIVNPENKLLLLQSHKWKGMYVIPGGHVELGERIEQTAVREAMEETGLAVHDLRFLCWQEFIYDPGFWKPRHFIFFDFAGRTDTAEVHLNDEAESYVWVEPQKALDLPMDRYMQFTIKKYLVSTQPSP